MVTDYGFLLLHIFIISIIYIWKNTKNETYNTAVINTHTEHNENKKKETELSVFLCTKKIFSFLLLHPAFFVAISATMTVTLFYQ